MSDTTTDQAVLVWLRNCYRLKDNEALWQATESGYPIIPVVIYSDEEEGDWPLGGASKSWLHHSLSAFAESLEGLGSRLILRRGHPAHILQELLESTQAQSLFYTPRYEPSARAVEQQVLEALGPLPCKVKSVEGYTLSAPGTVKTKTGDVYKVFTPFWKAVQREVVIQDPLPAAKALKAPSIWPESENLASWNLTPKLNWDKGFYEHWQPGEAGAWKHLKRFKGASLSQYASDRDIPQTVGTSRLSPHLHFGEISPRSIYQECSQLRLELSTEAAHSLDKYLAEIAWRDFGQQLLYFFPETPKAPLRPEFNSFPWQENSEHLKSWQKGQTGYPIVDAGMRELWHTGWMHNRVRMIVASFLVKHLLLPWQEGASWFWDTLVDADLGSNTLGWQWAGGCGADAAPYFRVFNPILQGKKFDPEGIYVKRWCPELNDLDASYIHTPWEAPPLALHAAKVQLGANYPNPIVDHQEARQRALAAFEQIKKKG